MAYSDVRLSQYYMCLKHNSNIYNFKGMGHKYAFGPRSYTHFKVDHFFMNRSIREILPWSGLGGSGGVGTQPNNLSYH